MKVFVVQVTAKFESGQPEKFEGRFVAGHISDAFILAEKSLRPKAEITLICIWESSEPPLREMPSISND